MERKIIDTADGSKTIYIEAWEETYHSRHGAIQEALHVFIQNGLFFYTTHQKNISILEIGFGTGLNAFISCLEAQKSECHIHYEGVEAYPVNREELQHLNYSEILSPENSTLIFDKIHQVTWGNPHHITPYFTLKKRKQHFDDIQDQARFHLIYFDAFGPRVQPELWGTSLFLKMYNALEPKGRLVTYSAKGSVRRALQHVGFKVTRLPGPPGKREMLSAVKP